MIAGSLDDLAGYCGPFAALSVEGMANERRPAGLNSSVMCWDADREAPSVRAIHDLLEDAYEVVSWVELSPNQRACLGLTRPERIGFGSRRGDVRIRVHVCTQQTVCGEAGAGGRHLARLLFGLLEVVDTERFFAVRT